MCVRRLTAAVLLWALSAGAPVLARTAAGDEPDAAGGVQAVQEPPLDSPPLVRFIEIRFPTQDNISVIEPQTYQFYIHTRPSRPSEGAWEPFDEDSVLQDFRRLWNTNFLDNLWIEVLDVPYDNGVEGKHIVYNMEERQRVKVVDYTGSRRLDRSKIDEMLREREAFIRLDSFIDQALVRRVEGIIRGMLAAEGHQFAEVSHEVREVAGGPKLVNLTFTIDDGPRVRVRRIQFDGNEAFSDRQLRRRMRDTKAQWFLSFLTGRGTFQEAKFEEDADRVISYYRDRGYITAQVGQPDLNYLEDSDDGRTRWVELRIPITEGPRYRVGTFAFDGNTVVNDEVLRPLFRLEGGDFYAERRIRDGLEKARELYGSGGYFEFTAFPDLQPDDASATPVVDITMRMQEGQQYFVNRIEFAGNTVTRDQVIRREMRLVENGVFNTEALKFSVRRLNQLGFFEQIEDDAIQVEKTPGEDNQVDVTLQLREQNRNQLTFGAGVSQFDGFFGQLGFQTTNFRGRGESLTLSIQSGARAHNYQVAFTEPFLFDRPITAGIDLFKREIRYIGQFTQASSGGNLLFGFPVADFTRTFMSYSYEQVKVKELNPLFEETDLISRNPFLHDSLLIGEGGLRTVSKVVPSLIHNTVDNPIFPTTGRRYTLSFDVAGLGGNTYFVKPRVEAVWYLQQSARTSVGLRAQGEYIRPYASTRTLPIFERLFLGGEYSVRGFDIRSIGPRDVGTPEAPGTFLVIGGNKSVLFNAEYLISVGGPVRLVLFYDAGAVADAAQQFALDQFKTSTGAEVRFFMPVLNVPFRLIFAYNPQRDGVLDNNFRPQQAFSFRFAVGSTF